MATQRAGSWSRQQARRLHLEFVRETWQWLLLLAALLAAGTATAAWAAPSRWGTVILGAGAASIVWWFILIAVQVTGTTRYMLGEQGEEWTAQALRARLQKGWHVFDHVPLRHGDVDHILLGPCGAYAFETKATHNEWNLDEPDEWLRRAVQQATYSADRRRLLLMAKESGLRTAVTPVLVLWGRTRGEQREIDGVRVIHGTELPDWRRQLPTDRLDPDAVSRAAAGLQAFVERRDAYIRRTERPSLLVELGPFALLGRVITVAFGALIGFMAVALAVGVIGGTSVIWIPAVGAAIGFVGRRAPRLRILALGWLAASVGILLLVAAVYVAFWLGLWPR